MHRRSAVSGFAWLGLFFAAGSVLAQGLPGRLPTQQGQGNVNPAHEQAKREAQQLYQNGRYEAAIEVTTDVLKENSQDHLAYYLRGSARVEQGNAERNAKLIRAGIRDAREAIRYGGADRAIYYLPYLFGMTNLAAVEGRDQHAEVALKVGKQILDQPGLDQQTRVNLLYQRARCQMFLEDYEEAIADYQQALQFDPQHLGAHTGLADAYEASDQDEQVLAAYRQAIQALPEEPLLYNNRGMHHRQQGNLEEAIADFTRALQVDANYVTAYINRGSARMENGNAQGAEADFTRSLQINSNQPMVYTMRGTARLKQGNLKGALADYQRKLQETPKNAAAHADVGFAHFFAKKYADALDSFNRARELNPELGYLNPWRYWCMVRTGEAKQAKQQFTQLLPEKPADRDWVDHLLAYSLGETSDKELLATAEPQKDSQAKHRLCEAHFFIGQRHEVAGDKKIARQHYRQALKSGAQHLSAYRGAQFALGKFSVAEAGRDQ